MNEMRDYTPITIAQLAAQPTATFAYKLVDDPSPGNKVMHLRTAGETFVYGLASYTLPLMTAGTGNEDIAKYIMVAYRHRPDPIFIVTTKTTVHVAAPPHLDFTTMHDKFGVLKYKLKLIPDYQPTHSKDSTKSIFSCVIELHGKDVEISFTDPKLIEQLFAEAVENIGFAVTRWNWAKSATLGAPLAKAYADLTPTSEPSPAHFFKFKEIRGPTGSKMTVKFGNALTDQIYTALCPRCLHDKKFQCICDKDKKRASSSTSDDKQAKKARNMAFFETAFD